MTGRVGLTTIKSRFQPMSYSTSIVWC